MAKDKNVDASNAYGEVNRRRLIDEYFDSRPATELNAAEAWKHVYRLLLWTDQKNGLAHCYESDKSQPGKGWYARSLAFHVWLANQLGVSASELSGEIDRLFVRGTEDLLNANVKRANAVAAKAKRQREPYIGFDIPEPGEDPELVSLVKEILGSYLTSEPSHEEWRALSVRVRQFLSLENKRKNMVGEGLEDVIYHVISRTCIGSPVRVMVRPFLYEVPGFERALRPSKSLKEKPVKVDMAIVRGEERIMVTLKWSTRADRERQFQSDFNDYITGDSSDTPFTYVLVTNEFDPARLMRPCELKERNAFVFKHVVHMNLDAVGIVHGPPKSPTDSISRVRQHVESGRLISLQQWLSALGS